MVDGIVIFAGILFIHVSFLVYYNLSICWSLIYRINWQYKMTANEAASVKSVVFVIATNISSDLDCSSSSSNFISNRIQQYNTLCTINACITKSRVVIDIVMWFCWWPPEKPWSYQAGTHIVSSWLETFYIDIVICGKMCFKTWFLFPFRCFSHAPDSRIYLS